MKTCVRYHPFPAADCPAKTCRLGTAALFMFCMLTIRAADFPTSMTNLNPAAWWRFNETAASPAPNIASNWSTLGAAGNGYVLEQATNGVAGRVGNAVQLIGNNSSCVEVPFNPALNPNPPFSLEFWVEADAQGDATGNCPLSSFNPYFFPNNRSGWLVYLNSGGRFQFRTGGENLYSGVTNSANGVASSSTWTYVAGTFDGTIQRLYINGARVAELALTSAQIANFQPNNWGELLMGRTPFLYGGNRFFTGLLDEVAVYASLLNDNTIKAHFDAATTNNAGYHAQILADSPVGYWPFEEPAYTQPDPNTFPIAANIGTTGSSADGTITVGVLAAQAGPGYTGLGVGDKSCQFSGEAGSFSLGGNPPALANLVGQVTMLAWIKPTVRDVGRTVVEHGYDNNGAETYLRIGDPIDWEASSDAPYTAYYEVGETGDATTYTSAKSPMPDGDIGNWVFLAGTFDGANWNLYRNGVLVAQAADTTGAVAVTNRWSVGSISDPSVPFGASFRFGGWINEPAIFTTALSAATILNLYLSANVPPVITRAPQLPAGNIYEGSSLSLSVWAEGNPTLAYQWYKNNSPLGVTTTNLALNNLTTANSGTYAVVVTNNYGSVTNSVVLTVLTSLPIITEQPQPASRFDGAKFNFSVTAIGSQPVSYYWKTNGVPIPGATSSTYSNIASLGLNGLGYSCLLSNQYGQTNSVTNTLTVVPAPPGYGSAVIADSPISYWRVDEASGSVANDYVGGNNGKYFNVTLDQPGYSVIDSDTAVTVSGSPDSYVGNINGNPNVAGPVINFQGANQSFSLEAWVNGPAQASGSAIIAKGTGGNGTTANEQFCLDIGDLGNYHFFVRDRSFNLFEVEATLGPGNVWDHVVGVYDAVGQAMYIYVNGDQSGSAGIPAAGVKASTALVSIGSKRDGTDPAYNDGFTGSIDEVAIYNTALSASQVAAHYAAAYGSSFKPSIGRQPTSLTNYVSLPATFSVGAYGTVPLTYQWKKNGVNLSDGGTISGSTASVLTINPLALSDAGNYSVTVTNSVGPPTNSATVSLTVLNPPSSPPAIPGLVVHLPFDGNLNDVTGRGNNGIGIHTTVTTSNIAAVTFAPDGMVGQALHYASDMGSYPGPTTTNNNYVTLGVRPDLQFSSNVNFTVAYWIRLPGNYIGGDLPFFTDTVNSTFNAGYVFAPSYGAGATTVNTGTANGGWAMSLLDLGGNGVVVYGDIGSINDGGWHHLVHVFERGVGSTTYLDGLVARFSRQFGTTAGAAGNIDTGNAATIGQDPTGTYGETGSGDIDDLGVWHKALTPLEAASIYMAGASNQLSYVGAPVTLSIQNAAGNKVQLTWPAGILQAADTVNGTYADVSGAISPFTIAPASANKFYRIRQ